MNKISISYFFHRRKLNLEGNQPNKSELEGERMHFFKKKDVFMSQSQMRSCWVCLQYYKHKKFQKMEEQVEIIELSDLSKEEILKEILQLLNDNEIKKLTLMVKCTPLCKEQKRLQFSYSVDETGCTINTTRGKSSTIDKYYRSANFINKSMNIFQEDGDEDSDSHSILPSSPKELGIKLYREGEYSEALDIFAELKEQFPMDSKEESFKKEYRQILTFLGNSHYRLKHYSQAITVYKELLIDTTHVQQKNIGQLYNNLGCCYARSGCQKLSMNAFNQAIKAYSRYKDIDCSLLLANVANVYSNCQMYSVAEKYYLQAIDERKAKSPKKKEMLDQMYRQLSLTREKEEKYSEALESLEKAKELAQQGVGNVIEVLFQQARVKEKLQLWGEALEDYEKIHLFLERQGMPKGGIYQKAARIHEQMGKQTETAKYILLALQEYKKEGNVRKVSELSNHRYAKSALG